MRNYIRKTNRGMVSQQQMQAAASEIIEKGRKLRQVAKEFDICHATLFRFVKKLKLGENPTVGYKPRLLFTNAQEKEIANHLVQYARIFLGLSIDEARKLAYQCMVHQKYRNVPSAWYKNGSVTREWLDKFLSRHPQVRMRPAKVTTGQSKDYINEFFSMLFKLLEEYKFLPSRMYHLVDISITPVVKYPKMATGSTFVPVGQGNIVNMQLTMNAAGEITPPMFVLPKADQKLEDGPHGLITGNDTGQITATEFSTYIDHFTKHTKPNPLDPILMLLHGNQYIDVNVLEKARTNSIILLCFPVCSKVERLESYMQPFEELALCLAKSVKAAQVDWLRAHPGKAVTCKIPKLVGKLLPPESDIKEAFRMTGLWPFRPSVVVGDDFVPSAVEELFLYDLSEFDAPGPSGRTSTGSRNSRDSLDSQRTEQDPLRTKGLDQCRFCAEFTKDCVEITGDKPYLNNNKTALTLNNDSVELDFNDTLPKTVCRDCDGKLQDMYDFVKQVKVAQELMINMTDETKHVETVETLIVKTECDSPTPEDDNKDGIIESITVSETEFVKQVTNKRKCDNVTMKKKKRKVSEDSSELIIDIKEETIDIDENPIDGKTASEISDTGTDDKPSELDLATQALVNVMAGDDGLS